MTTRKEIAHFYCEDDLILLEQLEDRIKNEPIENSDLDRITAGLLEINAALHEMWDMTYKEEDTV